MKLFSWFNPLWLVQNFFTTSINPITIGAGLGALGGVVTGKSPFKGALLGGTLGGLGNAAGLFGSAGAAASGAGGYVAPSATSGIVGTTGEIGSSLLSPTLASEGVMGLGSNAALNTAANAASLAPNFGLQSASLLDKIGFNNLSNMDKLSIGKTALDVTTPTPTPPIQHQGHIKEANPNLIYMPNWNTNPSSNTYSTSPDIGQQKDNAIGLLGKLKSRIPLTDEEMAQLSRLGQRG